MTIENEKLKMKELENNEHQGKRRQQINDSVDIVAFCIVALCVAMAIWIGTK